jgi:uncharacterized surface protein with fasciclin (FAS1) repeats
MGAGCANGGSGMPIRDGLDQPILPPPIKHQRFVNPVEPRQETSNPIGGAARSRSVVHFPTEVTHSMIRTSKSVLAALVAVALSLSAASVQAEKDPDVGGAAMYPSKNIAENAVNSKDHTTLVAAVKAAGLVETLEGPGPFTVFAPVNGAFDKLPAGTVDTLLKPESKDQLVKVLTYHVVAGKVSSRDLVKLIKMGGGKAELKTVAGGTLSASLQGGKVVLTDEKGGMATVTIADVNQSNGVIHVIDSVLLPN